MDLISNAPFPLLQRGIIRPYQSIDRDVSCEVGILGGGITGALISWRLNRAGIKNLVVDKRIRVWAGTLAKQKTDFPTSD